MIAARPTLACLTLLWCLALASTAAWADVGKRYALVIGNSGYENAEALPNAAHDASQIAQVLSELKFEVFAGFNLSRVSFERLIDDFAEQVDTSDADTVLIYYAGHGFELDGRNRLVPVDAALRDRSAIEAETFLLDDIVASVQSAQRRTILFLDACRDSPLPPDLQRQPVGGGLAEMRTGDNTFIAFATQPGNVSFEGTGRNSPFTEALLTHIGKPGLSLSDLMIEVRRDVADRTLDRQVPWNQSSLRQQFYFNPNIHVAMNEAAAASSADTPRIVIGGQPQAAVEPTRSTDAAQVPVSVEDEGSGDRQIEVAAVSGYTAGIAGGEAEPADEPADTADAPAEQQTAAVADVRGEAEPTRDVERSPDELIEPLQTHLRSIGCYRGAVDGDWGPLSRAAVKQYYKTKGADAPSLEPNEDLLAAVEQESGTVCKAPRKKAVAKKQPQRKAKQHKHVQRQPPRQHEHVQRQPPPRQHNYRARRGDEIPRWEGLEHFGGIRIGVGVGY